MPASRSSTARPARRAGSCSPTGACPGCSSSAAPHRFRRRLPRPRERHQPHARCLPAHRRSARPLSARGGREAGSAGNHISPMLISLASQMEGTGDRRRTISAGTVAARAQDRMVQRDLLSEWAELVVPALAVPAARLGSQLMIGGALPPAFNVIVSNVPGPKTPLFLAGAPVTELYPLGPVLDGAALNVTVISYGDDIHVGVVADRDAVPDVGLIADAMEQALEELRKDAENAGRR
ncbi:MAG TPA: WS/DGAT domain-containing protein [Acidimicrobiales bacterium]|nr:WS/DGAT domain-containing protein [Acidimicrobiales bacterium]